MNKANCLCEPQNVLIFPCSGGSTVGQIANEAAKELTALGHGKMYCLAGIGGNIEVILRSTKAAEKIVAIDGCVIQCARETLEQKGFTPDVHVVITDLGIQKKSGFMTDTDEIDKVVNCVIGGESK